MFPAVRLQRNLGQSYKKSVIRHAFPHEKEPFFAQAEREVVLFGSSAIINSPVPQMRKALEGKGIKVSNRSFTYKGSMGPIHMGHPNKTDLDDFCKFDQIIKGC